MAKSRAEATAPLKRGLILPATWRPSKRDEWSIASLAALDGLATYFSNSPHCAIQTSVEGESTFYKGIEKKEQLHQGKT